MDFKRIFFVLSIIFTLCSCGVKGDLYLPENQVVKVK